MYGAYIILADSIWKRDDDKILAYFVENPEGSPWDIVKADNLKRYASAHESIKRLTAWAILRQVREELNAKKAIKKIYALTPKGHLCALAKGTQPANSVVLGDLLDLLARCGGGPDAEMDQINDLLRSVPQGVKADWNRLDSKATGRIIEMLRFVDFTSASTDWRHFLFSFGTLFGWLIDEGLPPPSSVARSVQDLRDAKEYMIKCRALFKKYHDLYDTLDKGIDAINRQLANRTRRF